MEELLWMEAEKARRCFRRNVFISIRIQLHRLNPRNRLLQLLDLDKTWIAICLVGRPRISRC